MAKDVIVCLCDITGEMAAPWVQFGYRALLVDPQHRDTGDTQVMKFPGTVEEAFPLLSILMAGDNIAFVAGFPPCTDVAVSGARWWEEKRKLDPYFQAKAAIVAEQCRTFAELSGAPWFFENPVSAFSNIFGSPNHTFDPHEYSAYCADDQYTKRTCLWSGNGFIMPEKRTDPRLGPPDNRIFLASPGEERANFRSATPKGFARAVFLANCPEYKGQQL